MGTPAQPTPTEPVAAAPATPPQTTDDLLRAVLAEGALYRQQIAELQAMQAARGAVPAPPQPTVQLTPQQALEARMADINQHPYYCPGCGLLYDYQQRCTGKGESPHPPIEVVSTDELKSGDTTQHTAAPTTAS